MENQKDISQYSKDTVLLKPENALNTMSFSDFVSKKVEKLVTALYMVTDCMEKDEPMRVRLRSVGIELLSFTHSFKLLNDGDKQTLIYKSKNNIKEIVSVTGIALMMGFISEMNANILKREFDILLAEFNRFEEACFPKTTSVAKNYSLNEIMLDSNSFNVSLPVYNQRQSSPLPPSQFWEQKDSNSQGQIKDNNIVGKEVSDRKIPSIIKRKPMSFSDRLELANKNRPEKILSIIKSKKDTLGFSAGVSIKDIASAFFDCSEKTIQRELNSLVAKGQLKKTGEKRWSRYQIV